MCTLVDLIDLIIDCVFTKQDLGMFFLNQTISFFYDLLIIIFDKVFYCSYGESLMNFNIF